MTMTENQGFLNSLNDRFGVAEHLSFVRHPSGLIVGEVETESCQGSFFLLGSHVSHFQPRTSQQPVLFMSREAIFEEGKPIRGGIPICFPWFGPHPSDSQAPAHGSVRTELWSVVDSRYERGGLEVKLEWSDASWRVRSRIRFANEFQMTLSITNLSTKELTYEVAIHTYFVISRVDAVSIHGLEDHRFLDQLTKEWSEPTKYPIQFTKETDRIYDGEAKAIEIVDTGFERTVRIEPFGSQSTVIWNPWIEKSKRLNDFADDEYRNMCCVETANVRSRTLRLNPGEERDLGVTISCGG